MKLDQIKNVQDLMKIKDINEVELNDSQKKDFQILLEEVKNMNIKNEKDVMDKFSKVLAKEKTKISDEKLDKFADTISPILNNDQKKTLSKLMKMLKEKH